MDMLKYKIFNGVKKTFFWLMPLVVVVSLFYFLIADIAPITAQDNSDQSFSVERIRYLSGLNPDFDFLDDDLFVSLEVNGAIPINPQMEGRDNPFVAY
ncbi:MAG: hypothetical protein US76_02705 [Parcubacteria group bacterium GW2011_GWA2_38_13b]|nr:MAG: hypothetical protein US76_02705 [Parcubacteria group bacterium GW2011_GWA2_38_13b]